MVIRSSVDNILIATNGTKGQPGPAGTSSYIHIKYSNDGGKTFTDNDGETIGAYIGIYRDFTEDDSSKVTDYKWKKIEGEDGADAYTVMLSNENFTISTDTNYVPIHTQTFRCNIVVLKGADPADFTITAATDTENDIVTTISGHTVTIKVATVEALTESQGTIALTINVDNQSFAKDITWTVATQGVDGQTGVSITGVTNYYLATLADSGVTKETSGWTTEIQNMTEHDPYLWNYEVITGSNGQVISSTEPVIIGRYGRDGDAAAEGRGIYSIVEHYQVSSSNTEPPTTWSDTPIPTDDVNKYLWNYETITYTDNTSEDTQKRVIGTQGTNGTSVTVSSTSIKYAISDNAIEPPSDESEWGDLKVTTAEKQYLWTRTIINYSDGTSTTSYSVARQGIDGTNGEDGKPGKNGEDGMSTYVHIKYSSVSNPTDSDITEVPSDYIGICHDSNESDPTTASSYTWSKWQGHDGEKGQPGDNAYVHFAYASSADGSENFSVTAFVGAKYIGVRVDKVEADSTNYKDYTWSLIKGEDGNDGISISNVINYYLATSKSTEVTKETSGWTTTVQHIDETNQYLWNYEEIKGSDDKTISTTTPVIIGRYGVDGIKGDAGRGILSIVEHYQVSSSNTTPPTTWSDELVNTTPTDKYLWNYETITYTDGDTEDTTKRVIGTHGETGASVTVESTEYQAGDSSVTPPTGTWSKTPVDVPEGNYLWTKVTYSDGKIGYSVAKQGRTGDAGRGIKSITEYFLLSETGDYSKITLPEKNDKHGWTTVGEALVWSRSKPYLWHCTEVVYENSDGSEDYVYVDVYPDIGWQAADLVQANLTSFQQGVDNVIDRDNQSIRSSVWENTYTYKPKKDAEGNYVYDEFGKIVPDENTKTTMAEYMAESIVDRDGIRTKVEEAESSIDGLERKSSEIEQTADKINWVVKSGSSESNVTLTDSAINAVTNQFVIKDPQGNATIIEGGKIKANAITADMITANNLVGDHGWINLKDGKFYYGDDSTFETSDNAISWNGSKLQIKADEFLLASGKSIFDEIDAIETWFYAEAPTTSNEPAKNWTTDNLKEMHLRDVYFDTNTGKSYRWAKDGTTYKWVEIEDKELAAVEGRIAAAETGISSNTEAINLRATKTEVENTYATKTALADEIKNRKAGYGACATDAATVAKTVAISDFELHTGSTVAIKFNKGNTAAAPTLNVSNTGAKHIVVNGSASPTADQCKWSTNATCIFAYDGTYWRYIGSDEDTKRIRTAETNIDQNAEQIKLSATKTELKNAVGRYATSSTAKGTAAKVATITPAVTDWELTTGSIVTVKFTVENTAATPTLNVNSTGAKQIKAYTGTAALTEAEYKWKAGTTLDFVYDGTYWRIQDSSLATRVSSAEASITVNSEAITARATKTELTDAINQEVKDRDAAIQLSAEGVTSTVSKTYETKTDASAKLTEAKNDATSKANAAEKNAKDDTTEKLKSYYTATQTDSQIEQKADEIATRVSEEKISEIEIGGRNLAVNSAGNEWYTVTIADGTNKLLNLFGSPSKGYLTIPEISNIKKDDIIQVSFDIKFGENWQETGTGTKGSLINGNYNVGGTWASITFQGGNLSKKLPEVMASESREGHLNTYFTVTENMLNGTYTGVASSNIRFDYYSGDVSIRRVMVEKATKPSNWTPAPEDLESYADAAVSSATTEIKQTTDSITARVAANEIKIAGQYATSSTAADTKAKVATIIPSISDWGLYTGATVTVKFTAENTDATPTLNINNTGAKPIKNYGGSNLTKNEYEWPAGTTMAFVYDGTNWRVQDSTVMVNIKNAETQISQNAEAISLRATKEEAAQMAQPNLSPYFSHTPYSVDDYWAAWINDTDFVVTPKEDGWVRIQRDNSSGTAVVRRDCTVAYNPVIKEGTDYTILLEVRNNNSTGTGSSIYVVQQNNLSFWGTGAKKCIHRDDGSTTLNSATINIGDNYQCIGAGPFETRVVKTSEATGSAHWTGDMVGMMRVALYCGAGATIDCEARISIYEGEYSGPYKPYVGDLQFATQSELKVTADGIISSVTSVGAIVNMLPSVYYRENASGNTYVQNGITWTLNPDGSVTATGTATANSAYYFSGFKITADEVVPAITIDPERTYIVHGCPAGGSDNTYSLRARWTLATAVPPGSSGKVTYDYGDGTVLSPNDGRKYLAVWAHIKSGFTCPDGGLTFYPMVEAGTIKHGYVSNHIGATAQKLYSTIEQLPDKIESTVSSKYETKTDASAKLTEAKNDATSKANAAEKNAKDDTTEKLKSYYTKTETETKITQDATSIATSVSTQKIAELEIGGRNLLLNSKTMSNWSTGTLASVTNGIATLNGSTSNWNAVLNTHLFDATLYDGTTPYVFSFEYKSDAECYVHCIIASTASSSDKTSYVRTRYTTWKNSTLASTDGNWKKCVLPARTISISDLKSGSGDVVSGYVSMYLRTDDVVLQIRHVQLEKGNMSTTWSPAPEDATSYADTIVESAKSEIKQTTDAITASVTNIEIGGANLLKDSGSMARWPATVDCDVENNVFHVKTTATTARYADAWAIPLYSDVKGKTLTLSMEVKKSDSTEMSGLYVSIFSTSDAYGTKQTAPLVYGKRRLNYLSAFTNADNVNAETWTKIYITYEDFDFSESTYNLYDYVGFRVGARNTAVGNEGWFRNIKLEYGNKPTAFSTANDDILQTMRTEMTETADGIELKITNITADLNKVGDDIALINQDVTDTNDRIDGINDDINGDNGLNSRLTTVEGSVNDISFNFTNLNDNITNYFSFGSDGVLTLGKNGSDGGNASPFKTELSNEKISFKQDGTEIAYMSGNILHISDAEIMTTLRIGNFIFVPRSNGNMTLKYSPLSQEGE